MKRPFNEAKYKALLEGLEVSIVCYSQIMNQTLSERIDAEFFKKIYLSQDKEISLKGYTKLKSIVNKIDVGFVGEMTKYYSEDGIILLQTKNINSFFINLKSTVRIISGFSKQLKKSQIRANNILIARSGSFGKAAIYLEDEIINSSDIIIIEANNHFVDSYFLTAYLNSKVGVSQMIRFASGGLQGHVNLTILEELVVPNIKMSFQKSIQKIVDLSYQVQKASENVYSQAENLLLESTGLKNFHPTKESVNVKSFENSFLSTGRLDAEYYQPKYEEIVNRVLPLEHERLGDIVSIKKSIEPGSSAYSDEGLPFLRVADYDKFGLSEPAQKLSASFCKENLKLLERLKPKKETILFSKDGSVGAAYMLREDKNMITSGAILHLKVKDKKRILPEYLTLVLNSPVVQMQAERDAGGSIILHWRVNEVENVIIPIIDYQKQQEIAQLIETSFTLKSQSNQLLETAKSAVEMAIEQDEEKAMEYIQTHSDLS